MQTTEVTINEIQCNGCQVRAETLDERIEEYAEAWRDGAKFPPVVLFHDGEHYWPGDGIHRVLAARLAEVRCKHRSNTAAPSKSMGG
jgi:ParB-like chromosome segregation protein Spo0J